jgi:hypothetical protein
MHEQGATCHEAAKSDAVTVERRPHSATRQRIGAQTAISARQAWWLHYIRPILTCLVNGTKLRDSLARTTIQCQPVVAGAVR